MYLSIYLFIDLFNFLMYLFFYAYECPPFRAILPHQTCLPKESPELRLRLPPGFFED